MAHQWKIITEVIVRQRWSLQARLFVLQKTPFRWQIIPYTLSDIILRCKIKKILGRYSYETKK